MQNARSLPAHSAAAMAAIRREETSETEAIIGSMETSETEAIVTVETEAIVSRERSETMGLENLAYQEGKFSNQFEI